MGPKQVHGNMAGETVQSYTICSDASSCFRIVVLSLRSELRFAAPLRGHLAPLPSPSTLLGLPLHIPLLVCPFSLFASLLLSGAGKLGGESSVERLSRHVCILSPVCECACAYACACMCMCGEPVVPCLLIHAVAKVCAQACAR